MSDNNELENFVDRVSTYPNRRKLTIISQSPTEIIADVSRYDTNVTKTGTKISADDLQNIIDKVNDLECERFKIIQIANVPSYDALRQELYVQNGIVSVVNKSFTPSQLREIEAQEITNLRAQRESECFMVVNRGQLWYENLTLEQIAELKVWYQSWLDVTTTKIIPTKPSWLG